MAEVKRDGTSLLGKDAGLPPPAGARKPSSEARLPDLWYRRIEGQIEQAEQRYRERRRTREGIVHQLHDEGRTPLEVDSPTRVQARLRRLGIESAEGKLCPDTARMLSRVVPVTAEPAKLVYERVLGRSDLTSVCFLERGLKVSRTVGRIRIGDSRGRLVGYGTGFLVSPRLMLTNNHVLSTAAEAGNSQIEFNYQSGIDGASLPSVLFALDPAAFFLTNAALDYTLVAVKEQSLTGMPLREFGFNRLVPAEGKVLLGEYVNIIQHPNGEPKQLALRENQIVDLLDNFCHYLTDTAPGSSGSPVFNDQWEVVALHHMGVPKRSEDGRLLTVDGEPWESGMDPALLAWKANEGVRVSSLVRHISAQRVSAQAARLRAEVLESVAAPEDSALPRTGSRRRPGMASARRGKVGTRGNGTEAMADAERPEPLAQVMVSARPSSEGTAGGEARSGEVGAIGSLASPKPQQEPSPGRVILTDGGAALPLPLRLSIQIGLGEGGAPTTSTLVEPRILTPAGGASARRTIGSAVTQVRSDVEEALAELEQARRQPYFDEEASGAAQERYYAELVEDPDFERLSELVRGTHRTVLRYAPMRQVYPWVDLQPGGLLRSIYSAKEFDPEEFIREDARIDALRGERFREVLATEGSLGAEAMAARMELLEAALPYNCEHVVPQSWFGKREPMRGDLHHLFACESGCNSFRGNIPYFDFPDFEEAVREECGKRVANKFEPTSGKGAVARATLYFLLRYPGEINRTSTEYEESRIAVLLSWHQAWPPSLHERHRNEAIFERQGNRNPFIDHPEWAERVDFREGLS